MKTRFYNSMGVPKEASRTFFGECVEEVEKRRSKKKKKKKTHFFLSFSFSFPSQSRERAAPARVLVPSLLSHEKMPPPICYSAVYRGRDALASYAAPSASGSSSSASAVNNFRAVAASCLERCPPGGEAK